MVALGGGRLGGFHEGKFDGADARGAVGGGELVGKRALEAGITKVAFDRGGRLYHGRVAALADGARSAGLIF